MSSPQQPRIPLNYLCTQHREYTHPVFKWPLYRQIEDIRRCGCSCDIEGMYQWYDLVGQFFEEN